VDCTIRRAKERYRKQPEQIKAYQKERYAAQGAEVKARVVKRRLDYPETVLEEKRREYRKHRREYIERNAWRKKHTPAWITKEQIEHMRWFYSEAKRLKSLTGRRYEVDHIIPIKGKTVSGLHVPWNLQILTFEENRAKGNKLMAA